MEPLIAGLMAWTIELMVAITMLSVMKLEEQKVIRRRKDDKRQIQ